MRTGIGPCPCVWGRVGWWSEFRGLRRDSDGRLVAEVVVSWPESGGLVPIHADAHELARLDQQVRQARIELSRRSAEGNTN
jgi:hypothetical protein